MRHRVGHMIAAAGLVACVWLGGCSSSPEPEPRRAAHGAPIDYETANLMIDQMAQYIVTELPRTSMVQSQQYKMVLALGPMEVEGFAQPERFEAALQALQAELIKNDELKARFSMVSTSRADASDILAEASGSGDDFVDPLGTNADETRAARYAPDDVIVLTGSFLQTAEGPESKAYRLQVSIEHPRRRVMVLSREIRRAFVWDGYAWVPEVG